MTYIFHSEELALYGQTLNDKELREFSKAIYVLERDYRPLVVKLVREFYGKKNESSEVAAVELAAVLRMTEQYVMGKYKPLLKEMAKSEKPEEILANILPQYFNLATRQYADTDSFGEYIGRNLIQSEVTPGYVSLYDHNDYRNAYESGDYARQSTVVESASIRCIRYTLGRATEVNFEVSSGRTKCILPAENAERSMNNGRGT